MFIHFRKELVMMFRNSAIFLALVIMLLISACTETFGPLDSKDGIESFDTEGTENLKGSIQMAGNSNRKIVVYKKGSDLNAQEQNLNAMGIQTNKRLNRINAIAAMVPDHAKSKLLSDPAVLRIDDDAVV